MKLYKDFDPKADIKGLQKLFGETDLKPSKEKWEKVWSQSAIYCIYIRKKLTTCSPHVKDLYEFWRDDAQQMHEHATEEFLKYLNESSIDD